MTTATAFRTLIPVSLAFALLAGCTWVKVSPEAEKVTVLPADRVSHCQRVGVVSSNVKATVAGIGRNANKVRDELDNLARQQAVAIGANTLVRTAIVNGQGTYTAYHCP